MTKNTITLTNDTIETLRTLVDEIRNEEIKMDYEDMDEDLVAENLYKILGIVDRLVF